MHRVLKRLFRTHKTLILSLGFLFLFSFSIARATPPTSPYTAGATLDPSCAPGETNCTVSIPVSPWDSVTGGINYAGGFVGVGTTHPAAALDLEADGALLAVGNLSSGIAVPDLGAGTRLEWIPSASAFRVGTAIGTEWDSASVGQYSAAFGVANTASGQYAFAAGAGNTASSIGSVVFGTNNNASGNFAFAAGSGNTASSSDSIAIGSNSTASGSASLAAGEGSNATGNFSFAGGLSSTAGGVAAAAFGNNNSASGHTSLALGENNISSADYAVTIGNDNSSSAKWSAAIGDSNTVTGTNDNFAFGFGNTASGTFDSYALGGNSTASGDFSNVFGYNSTASGDSTLALGVNVVASGQASTAIGNNVTAAAVASLALGANTTAGAAYATVLGRYNVGAGNLTTWVDTDPLFEIGNGSNSSTLSDAFTVLKSGNVGINTATPSAALDIRGLDGSILAVGGVSSVSIPDLGSGIRLMWYPIKGAFRAGSVNGTQWDNANIGQYSVAFGQNTTANANSAAFGFGTTASGPYAAAFGFTTTASATTSAAFGSSTTASSIGSTAFGFTTTASGVYALSSGYATRANAYGSAAFGTYNLGGGTSSNWISTEPLFEVGNGDPGTTIRSDALLILKNGQVGINLGTGSPTHSLDVGNTGVSGIVARFQNSAGTCDINPTATALSCSSDMTLKTNIINLSTRSPWSFDSNITFTNQDILEKVVALKPVNYNWKTEAPGSSTHTGFIAQEVQQVFPDLVSRDASTNLLSLNYLGLVPYTIEAIKEMNVQVTAIDDLTKANTWRDSLLAWFADTKNGIQSFFSDTVRTNNLCVGTVCVTQQQFLQMVQGNNIGTSSGSVQTPQNTSPTPQTSGTTQSEQVQTPEVTPPTPDASTQDQQQTQSPSTAPIEDITTQQ